MPLTSTKSVSFSGMSNGIHRSYRERKHVMYTHTNTHTGTWLGFGGQALKLLVSVGCSSGENGRWTAAGRMRYSQLQHAQIKTARLRLIYTPSLVGFSGGSESRPRQLLAVQVVRTLLRVVLQVECVHVQWLALVPTVTRLTCFLGTA